MFSFQRLTLGENEEIKTSSFKTHLRVFLICFAPLCQLFFFFFDMETRYNFKQIRKISLWKEQNVWDSNTINHVKYLLKDGNIFFGFSRLSHFLFP